MNTRSALRNVKSKLATAMRLDLLYPLKSYSQEGEDLVLQKLFAGRNQGFYVDVGAHHPYRYSNTYLLYKQGWVGINIDATPGSMDAFKQTRSADINLEAAVGTKNSPQKYYCFADSAFNTFSKKTADEVVKNKQSKLVDVTSLVPQTLAKVLDAHLPEGTDVDYLNIDAEGCDLDILKSNNWIKYLPEVISVEVGSDFDLTKHAKDSTAKFLEQKGFQLYSRLFNTAIFVRRD